MEDGEMGVEVVLEGENGCNKERRQKKCEELNMYYWQ